NAHALVLGRDRTTRRVTFNAAYLAFCRDWDVQPRACAPYRARTKGKTEARVKFVKHNALAIGPSRPLPRSSSLSPRGSSWPISAARHHARGAAGPVRARRAPPTAAVAGPCAAATRSRQNPAHRSATPHGSFASP